MGEESCDQIRMDVALEGFDRNLGRLMTRLEAKDMALGRLLVAVDTLLGSCAQTKQLSKRKCDMSM